MIYCVGCREGFDGEEQFRQHIYRCDALRSQVRDFCPVCGLLFRVIGELPQHLAEAHGVERKTGALIELAGLCEFGQIRGWRPPCVEGEPEALEERRRWLLPVCEKIAAALSPEEALQGLDGPGAEYVRNLLPRVHKTMQVYRFRRLSEKNVKKRAELLAASLADPGRGPAYAIQEWEQPRAKGSRSGSQPSVPAGPSTLEPAKEIVAWPEQLKDQIVGRAKHLKIILRQQTSPRDRDGKPVASLIDWGRLSLQATKEDVEIAFQRMDPYYYDRWIAPNLAPILEAVHDPECPRDSEGQICFIAESVAGWPEVRLHEQEEVRETLRRSRKICLKERGSRRAEP